MTANDALHVSPDTWREIEAYANAAELARKRDRELDRKCRRGQRALVAVAIAAATLFAAFTLAANVHVYNGANAGVVIGPEYAHCGFEIRGVPGPFCAHGD